MVWRHQEQPVTRRRDDPGPTPPTARPVDPGSSSRGARLTGRRQIASALMMVICLATDRSFFFSRAWPMFVIIIVAGHTQEQAKNKLSAH